MRLSSHVEIGSRELELAGTDDISLLISETVVGFKSVSMSGTSLGMTTGVAAVAVDARMLATLLTKNFAKLSPLSLLVTDCIGG